MKWTDVLELIKNNPSPPRRVEKTDEEWKQILTNEQYWVTRQHRTERAFSGEYCEIYTAGKYHCICCDTELFDSTQKFDSQTGWPSFTEPSSDKVIRYSIDNSYGTLAVEVLCNVCDAHLGHVFPDGPPPSGLRFCINSVSLKKQEGEESRKSLSLATFGGGCFWCTEAIFEELEGVTEVVSGYAGGETENPTYHQIVEGNTGHAEVVQVHFDQRVISYDDLLRVFLATHNPTSPNGQGADRGTNYRSIILYHDAGQHQKAKEIIAEMQPLFNKPIVTELVSFKAFYEAEQWHQDYYRSDPDKAYCQTVITPKLQKMRSQFGALKKKNRIEQ